LNPGRCGGKPATNRLSYGVALEKNVTTVSREQHSLSIPTAWRRLIKEHLVYFYIHKTYDKLAIKLQWLLNYQQ
jgi:hypothetical protein